MDAAVRTTAHQTPFIPVATLLLAAPAVLLAIPQAAWLAARLEFNRGVPEEWHRWMTCHWAHWSASHVIWNVAAFLVLGAVCERQGRTAFLACVATSAIAVSAAVAALVPSALRYRGLSGIDSALFVLCASPLLAAAGRDRRPLTAATVAVVLAAFVVKIAFELRTGRAAFVRADGFALVPLAHVAGAAVGAVFALIDIAPLVLSSSLVRKWVAIP